CSSDLRRDRGRRRLHGCAARRSALGAFVGADRTAGQRGRRGLYRLGAFPAGFDLRDEILQLYGEALPQYAPAPHGVTADGSSALDPVTEVARFFDTALGELGALRNTIDLDVIARAVA